MNQFLAVTAFIAGHLPEMDVVRRLGLDVRGVRKWARRIKARGGHVSRPAVFPQVRDALRDRIAEHVGSSSPGRRAESLARHKTR